MLDIFYRLFFFLVRISPYCIYRALTRLVAVILYALSPRNKRNALETLTVAFKDKLSRKEKKRLARASFDALFLGITDFIYGLDHPEFLRKTIRIEGREHLDAALKKGKGVAVAIAHFGPFPATMSRLALENYLVYTVMRPFKGRAFAGLCSKDAAHRRIALIDSTPVRACVVAIKRALENNAVVLMPIDQNYGGQGRIFVDFFGRPAGTAPGPVLYGVKEGVPVLTMFMVPEGPGRWKLLISPEVPMPKEVDVSASIRQGTAVLTRMVEDMARQYPDQWSWMHKRWKCVRKEGEL